MSTAWRRVHDRYQLAARVLAEVRRSRQSEIPTRWADDIEAVFGGVDGLLQHVQRRWYTALAARVDALLEEGAMDRQAAVRAAWSELARVDPASRLLLDAYAGHAALSHGERRHSTLLAAALAPTADPDDHSETSTSAAPASRCRCPLRSLLLRLMPLG